ncbi:hypothetical protein [Hymenobacter terrenus]|uniref:hypothetical protein n=1 Tax=Hymenobacter terrenus TaxID=1629124 RepID=UPI0006198E30|nr:hypothetical protein [Hymenobacter terrenus]
MRAPVFTVRCRPVGRRRALAGLALLLALLPPAARAQAPTVTVTPAGPLTLCPGSSQTLMAAVSAFNAAGSGVNLPVEALAVQADGKLGQRHRECAGLTA